MGRLIGELLLEGLQFGNRLSADFPDGLERIAQVALRLDHLGIDGCEPRPGIVEVGDGRQAGLVPRLGPFVEHLDIIPLGIDIRQVFPGRESHKVSMGNPQNEVLTGKLEIDIRPLLEELCLADLHVK